MFGILTYHNLVRYSHDTENTMVLNVSQFSTDLIHHKKSKLLTWGLTKALKLYSEVTPSVLQFIHRHDRAIAQSFS